VLKTASDAGRPVRGTARWVVVLCGGRRYGLPLERVSEITAPLPFTRLPGAAAAVCGLVGLRGRVVTVFDLGALLEASPAALSADHRLLLLELDGRCVGVVVDAIASITEARLEPASDGGGVPAEALLGRGRADDGDFTALDPAPLLLQLLAV
jgi:purine-binding chemotaxis protein CheW